MKALVIYDSKYGNTQAVASVVANKLGEFLEAELQGVGNGASDVVASVDLLVVGGPTQMHGISPGLRSYLASLPDYAVAGVQAAAFDTRTHGARLFTGSAANGIARVLNRMGAVLIVDAESFIVEGTEGPLVDGELDRARVWADLILEAVGVRIPEVAMK